MSRNDPVVHFYQDTSVSNPFALNTEIVQAQEISAKEIEELHRPIGIDFAHPQEIVFSDSRFNTSTDEFNKDGRFAKFIET